MPELGKHTLTRYLGSDCTKQLKILMSSEAGGAASERAANGMPLKQKPLPGLRNITDAGDEWAATRLLELDQLLGSHILQGTRSPSTRTSGIEFTPTDLTPAVVQSVVPGTFLAEYQFDVLASFEAAFDFAKSVSAAAQTGQSRPTLKPLRPDLIEVRAPGDYDKVVDYRGDVHAVADTDNRIQLRVIDIKLTSQPGPGYFAEVVYYSVALAGWLRDNSLDSDYAVSADPAVWPGNHEASALKIAADEATNHGTTLSVSDGIVALQADLVPAPVPVFVSALQHFFTKTLPEVIATDWDDLPFHVSQKCRGCDFLGDNPHDDPAKMGSNSLYCMQTAEGTEHLSRIPFLSRGAKDLLTQAGTETVSKVAATPPSALVFGSHHSLRAQRTVISARAESIAPGSPNTSGLIKDAGTSGALPRFSDLNIFVTADFDSSSAITLALGVTGFYSNPADRTQTHAFTKDKVLIVDQRSHAREQVVLIQFLQKIDDMVQHAIKADTARGATPSKSSQMQVYVWDDLTYKHLCRVVGRHLPAILAAKNGVRALAWLFPSEEIVKNDKLVGQPLVSIVSDAVKALVKLPVAHHYTLLDTARNYHMDNYAAPYSEFRMPRFFEVPLSDQIPSERAHDIWNRNANFADTMSDLRRAVGIKLDALDQVTRRLRKDLSKQFRRDAARVAYLGAPSSVSKMTADELLIYAHARLDAAVDRQETVRNWAMPVHEREARFASMRLSMRLTGTERDDAFARLGMAPDSTCQVFEVRPESLQAKFKDGDFTCAIVPEDRTDILDLTVHGFVKSTGGSQGDVGFEDYRTLMSDVLGVTVAKFDRDLGLIVLRPDTWGDRPATRRALIADGRIALDQDLSLERVSRDFLTSRLKDALASIGKTPKAVDAAVATTALGQTPNPRKKARVPVEDVLWDARAMASQTVVRDVAGAQAVLRANRRELNASQWSAFEHALSHRLSIIWGPPGTGKSRTVVNIVAAAAWDAHVNGKPLRVLISSNTYTAIDNVLGNIADVCHGLAPDAEVYRGRSESRPALQHPHVVDLPVSDRSPSAEQVLFQQRLDDPTTGITILGAAPQQAYKVAVAAGSPVAPLFDLIVIDEAGQIDTANAVLPLATLAEEGSVVVAGDPLQLPPIHQVEPPKNAEYLVGSIYTYLRDRFDVPSQDLLVNYRSNEEIVALARDADYPAALVPHAPGMRVGLVSPLPASTTPPTGWPTSLAWSPVLADLLNPDEPVTCVVYKDGLSGQSNAFEAQIVAGLAWLLDGRTANGLSGALDHNGAAIAGSSTPYTTEELFTEGLGVVTPHRAQQSEVIGHIRRALPSIDNNLLRDAIDTVERFQGQERDIIIASYAVGDPDTISDEDEFLLMLNRFNVMVSRAKAKIIVLVSEEVLRHLPTDIDVLWDSRMLKAFADIRCRNRTTVDIPWFDGQGNLQTKTVSRRTS